MLIDSRHGLKDIDKELMAMLDEAGVHYRIVLTKTDKMKSADLANIVEQTETSLKKHAAAFPHVCPTSAHKSGGLDDLRDIVMSFT